MRVSLMRTIAATALAAALMASVSAVQSARAEDAFAEDDIRRMADDLRNGTISVSAAADECRRGLDEEPDAQEMREVFAAFLEVPEDYGLAAFCRALAQAIKDGELTAEGMVLVSRDGRDAATALEVGRLLRAVYFSHVVTTTASAEGRRPQ